MEYHLEIEIDLPREKVSELFGDPGNLAYWQPGFVSIEHLSGEEGKSGGKSRLVYTHGKKQAKMEMIETLEVNNLPEEFTSTYEAKGMVMKVRNQFEEIGPNKTKWTSDNEAQVSGFMMKLFALLMPGCFKKQSFIYMENFKAFAEEGADVRTTGK